MRLSVSLLVCLFIFSTSSVPLPYTQRTCGPNNKVNITETVFNGERVDDNQIFFLNNKVVLLRTSSGRVLRSSDEGWSWEEQTVTEIMGQQILGKQIMKIIPVLNPDGDTVYFLGSQDKREYWLSTDGGETYKYYTLPVNIYDLIPHPKTPTQALALHHSDEDPDEYELWVGSHAMWNKAIGRLPSYGTVAWNIFQGTQKTADRIYVLTDKGVKGVFDGEIVYSDDFFKTQNTISSLKGVYKWLMYPPNNFVVSTCTTTNTACDTKELHISEDGGETFTTAIFPNYQKDSPEEDDLYVFELADNAIWVHVSRECSTDLCWGDMFHSNSADKKFTLSLQYQRKADFTKFNSVDGIYVANQYITSGRSHPNSNDPIRSLITYNKGSVWQIIPAPERDAQGQPTNCRLEDQCGLHIHGWQSLETFFTYFYSVPNAIGLMIATGNIGKRLIEGNADSVSTYISFNGGVEWIEAFKGPWVPEIGDHGSIITMVKQTEDTNEVRYTIDDGLTWESCVFTDQVMDVKNIRVSVGWNSRRFLIYGSRTIDGSTQAVLVHLNFEDAFSGKCVFPDDYESWSPTDEHKHCVMGSRTTYMRRIKGRNCYFGEEHEHVASEKSCLCNIDDYDCDHCFYRPDLASPCTLECTVQSLPEEPEYCVNSTYDNPLYYLTDLGYQFIVGDKCNNTHGDPKPQGRIPCKFGEDVVPQEPPHSPSPSLSLVSKVLIGLLVVGTLLAIGSLTIGLAWKTNIKFRRTIKETFGFGITRYNTVAEEDVDDNIELDDSD